MKKIIISLSVAGVLIAGTVSAQGMMGYGNTAATTTSSAALSSELQAIYSSQNITSQSQLDCSKISDDQLEKVGDAYMGHGISEAQHTAMENMMGGEGSATLRQAHVNMGRAYVGCWSNYNKATPTMSMMNGDYNNDGASRGGMMGNWGLMMGNYAYGSFGAFAAMHVITMLLLWALLILGIIALVKFLRKK